MTKEETINWLRNLRVDIGKIEHQELWHYEQALEEIMELLKDKWIPCSERLPEKSTDVVLVTVIDERRSRDIYLMRCDEVESAYILKWISAWMPLPEPYNGEKK